jgi:hypothetical protein
VKPSKKSVTWENFFVIPQTEKSNSESRAHQQEKVSVRKVKKLNFNYFWIFSENPHQSLVSFIPVESNGVKVAILELFQLNEMRK